MKLSNKSVYIILVLLSSMLVGLIEVISVSASYYATSESEYSEIMDNTFSNSYMNEHIQGGYDSTKAEENSTINWGETESLPVLSTETIDDEGEFEGQYTFENDEARVYETETDIKDNLTMFPKLHYPTYSGDIENYQSNLFMEIKEFEGHDSALVINNSQSTSSYSGVHTMLNDSSVKERLEYWFYPLQSEASFIMYLIDINNDANVGVYFDTQIKWYDGSFHVVNTTVQQKWYFIEVAWDTSGDIFNLTIDGINYVENGNMWRNAHVIKYMRFQINNGITGVIDSLSNSTWSEYYPRIGLENTQITGTEFPENLYETNDYSLNRKIVEYDYETNQSETITSKSFKAVMNGTQYSVVMGNLVNYTSNHEFEAIIDYNGTGTVGLNILQHNELNSTSGATKTDLEIPYQYFDSGGIWVYGISDLDKETFEFTYRKLTNWDNVSTHTSTISNRSYSQLSFDVETSIAEDSELIITAVGSKMAINPYFNDKPFYELNNGENPYYYKYCTVDYEYYSLNHLPSHANKSYWVGGSETYDSFTEGSANEATLTYDYANFTYGGFPYSERCIYGSGVSSIRLPFNASNN